MHTLHCRCQCELSGMQRPGAHGFRQGKVLWQAVFPVPAAPWHTAASSNCSRSKQVGQEGKGSVQGGESGEGQEKRKKTERV